MSGHLLVLDGDNLAHRLYHAVHDRPAAEAFGFALTRLRKRISSTHMVAVFDPHDGHSWRRELWAAYKPHEEKPESLVAMLREAKAECRAARIAVALDDGLEADDLIGAYVEAAVAEGMDATIVSSDKDLAQLVRWDQRRVCMLDEVRKIEWWPETVRGRFGVEPERLPDLLALVGDKSDGYPGVPNIGPKSAAALLRDYGPTLEQVLANKNLVRSKRLMTLLREHEEQARLCYRLACLRVDAPLPVPLDGCAL